MTPGMMTPAAGRMRVGRVVTTYGHWRLIARWLDDGALRQPFVDWVFVNDKPDDPPPAEVRAKVTAMGRLIELPANAGRCCARNLGAAALQHCEWLDIVDGDDLPRPFAPDFDAGWGKVDMVYFTVVHHAENAAGAVVAERDDDWAPSPLNRLMEAVIGNCDCRPVSVLWRTECFATLGGFDGRTDYMEDFNLCVRAGLAGVVRTKTPQIKASYQRHPDDYVYPPVIAFSALHNWKLARALVSGRERDLVDEQIRFYRRAVLWTAMRELEIGGMRWTEKLYECVKWLGGKHRYKSDRPPATAPVTPSNGQSKAAPGGAARLA